MAERPLYTLYKNLKAQNYDVPDDYNKFESALTRDGKGGADNRHAIYENLKAQNFDVPSTYERFYSALFEPRSKTSSRAKGGSVPMTAADRARFSAGAAAISASAQQTMNNAGRYNRLKQRKQKQQKDFGRVNLGTHQTPYGGDANNVVKDDFAYNPETGKAGAYVTSDNENVYSLPEAEQSQAHDVAYQNAVDTGEIPSVLDVRDQNGNYDLQENINKNGTYLTEEGAQKQFDKKLEDAYARKKEIETLIAEDNRQHGNPLLSYGASIGASNGRTAEQSDYRNKLATSLSLVTEQIGALEAVKQYPTSSWGEDALKALDNTAFTAKTWDFGLTDFATMGQMERIKTKMDNNIPLSGSDKMLLKSKLGADAAAALEDEKMGSIYRWTKIAGQSLPFMLDFFLTGGYGGITKGISRGALKFAAKRGMGKVSAAILKNTGIVAGDVIGSYAMAGTEQALKTGADIMQRHLGNLYQDEQGDYKFGTFDENGNLLHEGGESMGTALYKGLTSAMVENYTEKLFGHNYGIKKGAIAAMEKHGMNGTAQFFKNIGKSGWYTNSKKWMEKFGINGFGEEVMEEEIGIPLHALLDGDNKFSDLGDAKQQLDIIGGMAISVGSMYAMHISAKPVYNHAQYYRFRYEVNVADSDAQNLLGDNWADIKDKIDNATNEQMGSVLVGIIRQRDTMTKEQINAAINYGINLMKMRGYNVAKTAEMNAREITNEPTTPEEQHQTDIDNAYSEGHDADDADKHDIQLEQNDKANELAAMLHITPEQLHDMADEDLEAMTGQDDKLDQAIYDYKVSTAKYQGVMDGAQDEVDMAAHQAAMETDNMTDLSRGTVRKATIKATGGLEDYEVYIISGNIATHDDGSIDVGNSDDMIIYYDPTTGRKEHADAMMFADLIEELPAADVKAQAIIDAKENAIKKIAGIIDGTVEVGSQFSVTDADGTEHTYEVLADNGDGTAMITIDGNVPTELVKGENVQIPYSFADLQQMKDAEDLKRLEAAKAEREQMEKERAAQQTQETQQTEETQPSFDFTQILNDNGNVVLADVLGKDGNTKYPNSQLFLIRDSGAKAKVMELTSDGSLIPHAVNKKDVRTATTMTLDEYKQAFADSSMIEENSGVNRGEIEVDDELPPVPDNVTINGDGTFSVDGAVQGGENTTAEENTPAPEQTPAMTLEDGTIVPMLEDGNPDFSKLTAEQTAELYDTQFGEDADGVIGNWVSEAKKALDKANNMAVKGKTFVEQKAAKDAKEKAIAEAQAAYDSAIAIRDAYNERQLAKVEDTAEGRKNLIDKARRKFARLKSAVKDDAEAVAQLYKDTVGSLLHRLYDGTGIDVTDTIPLTAEEYVASNLGAHSLNYEGTETSKGVKQETGLSREDFAKTQLLAANGKGTTIDNLVHSLWENRPSNLESLGTQEIRNALLDIITSGFKASEARNYIENLRIAQAESALEEQKKAADNAAFAEEQKAEAEQQTETAPESEEKTGEDNSDEINDEENEKINEQTNENINAPEVPEDATAENPLGAQREQTDIPFSARDNGTQQTTAERAADVEKNKVDDMKVVDNIVGKKTRKAFERLAKMMGANIQWQYSDKMGNGWIQETKDADGNVHRTIFITLDSSITEGAQFIFGHEMTHQIKNLNPAAYNELTQLVLDTYGTDAFDKAVDETMKRYSDAGFSGRARDYYAEEVVADAVGEMIRDLNLAHTLAMKMSHPLLAAIHEILQKIKLAFYGTEYSDVTKNIIRSIEQAYVKTAKGEVMNSETGEDVSFSLRQKPEPKKKGIGYKVFVLKDGKLYPPMVANPNGAETPVGVWLDADAAPIAGESKTGRPQVKQGGKGTQGGSGKLAYRPGWHLGVVPYAIQFNRKDAEGNKTLFPKNFVFAEVEYAADVDYQEEARQEGINPSGKYQHSLAGLKHLPTDGYYMYRTNPNPETDPWVITGAMKVNRILTRAEQAELVKKAGREPQQIQEGDIVTDDVVNSINQEIAAAPKFSLKDTFKMSDKINEGNTLQTAASKPHGGIALYKEILANVLSAAKIDKSSETAKENGEKFSLKDEKTLAGVHNITEEKLRKALKLGGFANPSLAVIDTSKSGHDNFGEISFIAPSALLDKRTGKTAGTWITDAYTQRYPSVEREMSEKGYRKFEDWVDSLDYPSGAKAEIERQAKDALSDNNAPAWELMYLKENGIDIKEYDSRIDYRWKEIISDHPTAEDILNSMKTEPELNEKVTSLAKHAIIHPTWEKVSLEVRRKMYKETGVKASPINPQVRKQTKEIFERDYAPTLLNKDGSPRKKDVKKVVEDIVKEHNDTKKYDFYLSKVKASNYVNKNGLYDDYIRWQENKLDEFGTKNRIFRGYTRDGSRKYVPETLENVSKAMREEADGQTNGSEYTSFGSFIAKLASRVDSTDEMRANKDKLSSNKDKEEFYEKWSEVYYELAKFLYNDVFYGEQRLHDIVLQSDPKKYAKKEYGITLTPTFMKKLDALKNAVQTELKSAYFETKYNRPLRLNEFAAVVVPDNLGEDVRKGIEDAGLPMYDYDPNKEGDRSRAFNEAINSSDNIRFSLKAEKEKIVADAKANGTYMTAPNGEKTKLDAEQWATVRTTNFKNWFGDWENDPENASKVVDENGEPMVVWHGRSAEFNTFEKKEGVRFIMGLEDKVKAEGFFFSHDKGLAEEFASNSSRHRGGKANVVPCFLNIRKPMDLTGEDYDRIYEDVTGWEYMVGMDTQDNLWGIMDEEGMADKIKEKGYDGAIFVEEVDDSYEPTKISYCALDANQIKSAENNNGDFSADNNDIRYSIRTYHGTGASFDKFDLSHALEGEGSETFGHGVYVTNSSKIGREYAQRAKQRKMADLYKNMRYPDGVKGDIFKRRVFGEMVNDVATGGSVASAKEFAKKRIGADANDIQRTLENLKDREKGTEYEQNLKDRLAEYKEGLKWIDSLDEDYLTQGNANRYDVDIPDDNGSNYLDWENPMSEEQINAIRDALAKKGVDVPSWEKRGFNLDLPFKDVYSAVLPMMMRYKPEDVSQFLSSLGFTGIKYPAGMVYGGAEEGDYNYVIFDENNANIVGNTRFSLRYDQFEHDLNQWKKDNNLPKDAQRPTIPQRNAGESAVDFLRRVDEYRKQMALWKTAPTYEQHLLSDDTALGEFNRELQRGSVLKRIAFQDSMLAIRKAQEAIMKEVGVDRLNMAEDAYTAENRSHGKGKNEFEEYNNEFLQPLRKAYHQMKKILGDSYDNVRIYMMAKHGLERDAQMAFKKSLDADFEDVAQRSAAYRAYKGDMNRITNDSDLEFGRVDFNTWRQRDNALRTKYSPSYMDYRYDENGIAYDYSGLSALFGGSDFEEAAHKLVRDIESSHVAEVQDLWNATNAATKKILRDGYKAGMMSKDTYQYVRDMYSHYIPLRGWDGTTADQVWDYVGGGKGAFNQTLKTAHGRTSIADDPIAYIENMAESGILLNNKNWVKQHLMLLAQNHPTSLLTLSKAWYVKSTDANGNEEWIPATPQITSQMNSNQVKAAIDAFEKKMEQMAQTGDATQKRDGLNIAYPQTHSEEREHEVRVMKDGEEYVIYVNGDPQLAQAMNNTRAHRVREIQSGKLDRAAAWLGRKMAAAYTSLSPLFIPSNYFRDLTMTLASTAIREDAKYNYLLRKNLATSWNLGFMLRDYQNGKLRDKVNNGNATPKEQMFYDFMMNGGETGFVSSLDVEDLKKKFKNDLKDLDRWKANPVKVGHTIMDGIEFLNRAIEDSNRFAIYMTSIQYGRSIDEAVNDAKDVTLNFNRKGTGEYGWQMVRNLYLFINPAVQSLQTLGALAKHHPFKFTAVTASWLVSGVLVPIVNAALMNLLGGDDDKDKYWQFTKWDRRNNLIMWVPFTHEFVKIPLAQEFRAFYGIGDMIASKTMGGELAEESWNQYAEDLLGQVVDMLPLDPTGYDGNIAVSLMPNAIRPVFELAFNVDFTGKPLFKDTEYNKYDPNFTKAYVGTPDWLVRASRMINSIGNDYPDVQQNSIDAFGDPRYNLNNPAVVDHVLSSYLGGAYTMGSQVLGVLTKSLNDPKEIKMADIPLLSKFVSNPDDRPVTKKQGDEFWDMKENHDRAANTLSKLKKQAKVDGDYSMLERFYDSEEYKQYKQDDVKVKKYEEDKKKERAEESGEEYRPHKLNAEDIYKSHATPKDDFEDLKLKQLFTKLNGFKTSYDLLVDTAPSQSDGYYNTNRAAIDAIDEISLDKQEISELKKGFLDDGKDAYNAEDMKRIRELRKNILDVLEKANKVVVANQKAKAEK